MKISANLGFLWTELDLPDAIQAAARAGFDAVEFHWPFDHSEEDVRAALREAGLPVISINTRRGPRKGDFGLSALPGRETEAREAIEEAANYASVIGARWVHVMAGIAAGPEARKVLIENLNWALKQPAFRRVGFLIEPINSHDAPGYMLHDLETARAIVDELADPRLRLMFDCYHVGRSGGDIESGVAQQLSAIGHVQIAGVPDRGPPDQGVVNYQNFLLLLGRMGYRGYIGAEYDPGGPTRTSLAWLEKLRRAD